MKLNLILIIILLVSCSAQEDWIEIEETSKAKFFYDKNSLVSKDRYVWFDMKAIYHKPVSPKYVAKPFSIMVGRQILDCERMVWGVEEIQTFDSQGRSLERKVYESVQPMLMHEGRKEWANSFCLID